MKSERNQYETEKTEHGFLEIFRKQNRIKNVDRVRHTVHIPEGSRTVIYVGEAYDLRIPDMVGLGDYDMIGRSTLSKRRGGLLGRFMHKWDVSSGYERCYFVGNGKIVVDQENILSTRESIEDLSRIIHTLVFGHSRPIYPFGYRAALKEEAKLKGLLLEPSVLSTVFEPIDKVIMGDYVLSRSLRYRIC